MSKANGITHEEWNRRRRESYKKSSAKFTADKLQKGLCRQCGGQRGNEKGQHCSQCKDARRSRRLKSLYGVTLAEYEELAAYQDWVCWICGKNEVGKDGRLHVDHDHKTGKVRGLLCLRCNSGIGSFLESSELLQRAIEYLRAFND